MAAVENRSDRVAVMYLGQIVEMGTRDQIFSNPRHLYTKRLIDAVPIPDPQHRRARFPCMEGEVPSPVHARNKGPIRQSLTDVGVWSQWASEVDVGRPFRGNSAASL